MTTAQITSIIGAENLDARIHIPEIAHIAFFKDKNVIKSDIKDVRFKFDTNNTMLEVIYVRPYSQDGTQPPHGNYDTLDWDGTSTIFEYLTDVETGSVIVDYFAFSSITMIVLKEV